jgi:hypothetical protein
MGVDTSRHMLSTSNLFFRIGLRHSAGWLNGTGPDIVRSARLTMVSHSPMVLAIPLPCQTTMDIAGHSRHLRHTLP